MITAPAAQFYTDNELCDRQDRLTGWLATNKPGAKGARWSDVLRWLNVVQAEMANRGLESASY